MLELGLSPIEIGFLASLGVGVKFGAYLLGGYAADRWGRREAITTFDLLGFSASIAILSQAQTFWHFLVATLLGGLSTGSQAAWNCILVEEVAPAARGRVVTLERLLVVLPSIALPVVAALAVDGHDLVAVVRLLYLVALASITTMVVLRWILMPTSGAAVVDSHRRLSALASAWVYTEAFAFLLLNRRALTLLLATLLVTFAGGLGIYYSIYVTVNLHIQVFYLGYFAAVGTAVGLLGLLPGARTLAARAHALPMLAQGLAAAGVVVLLAVHFFIDSDAALLLLVASVLVGGVGSILWTVSLTLNWASILPDRLRSKGMATQQALVTATGIPSGVVAGALFQGLDPLAPWVLMAALLGVSMGVLALGLRATSREDILRTLSPPVVETPR